MRNNQRETHHYRTYLKMYGGMMQDLSVSDAYIAKLIGNNGLDEFETSLRKLIEKLPKY